MAYSPVLATSISQIEHIKKERKSLLLPSSIFRPSPPSVRTYHVVRPFGGFVHVRRLTVTSQIDEEELPRGKPLRQALREGQIASRAKDAG